MDLATYLNFGLYLDTTVETAASNTHQINSPATIVPVSAKAGEGLNDWYDRVKQIVSTGYTEKLT